MPYSDPVTQRRWMAAWKRRRRERWLAANGPCASCGSWERLEVDHKDPATKVDHKIWTWAADRRAVELAKCQVLCHPCHRAKTDAESRARAAKQTHCIRGHSLADAIRKPAHPTRRSCRQCHRDDNRQRSERLRQQRTA